MTFTSPDFVVFFALFFALYWLVFNRSLRWQNVLILVASYVFYGWWDWRFLLLIFASSLTDYLVGMAMDKTEDAGRRKWLLGVSLVVNLGVLGFFKYFDFFLANLGIAIPWAAPQDGFSTLGIILPVGISFYTLQTLSYTIDIYRKELKPTTNFIDFFAFVSFFPQLVAGPIERASRLLPQIQTPRKFDYAKATDGLRQAGWGFFKKMVVADNLAPYINDVFANYDDQSGSTLLLTTFFFIIQIYCDFSGYSDIAIGLARTLGFELMKNFDFPYCARSVAELWQRWHISLMTWVRDYVMSSMGGYTKWKLARNVLIAFGLVGLWHGAAWHFIVWGLLNAVAYLTEFMLGRRKYPGRIAEGKLFPTLHEAWLVVRTAVISMLIGVFFRSESVADGVSFLVGILSPSLFSLPKLPELSALSVLVLLAVDWLQREEEHGLDFSRRQFPTLVRWLIYVALIYTILIYGGEQQEFIYFQF